MVIRMRIIYAILCILFVSSSISYGYEQVPEDAKVKKEDVSKEVIENQAPGLGKTLLLIYLVMVQKKLMLCLWINH